MLKTSRYNYIWPIEGSDKVVVFNSFTTATVELKKCFTDLLEEGRELSKDTFNDGRKMAASELKKGGFLIEDYIDELNILKFKNAKGRFDDSNLSLTIIPTFNCNLQCFYCYQDRNNITDMSQEVQAGIIDYVQKYSKNVKNIAICWFGGEPLLAWDSVCRMSSKFIEIAEENNCEYQASIITNGYLFNDEKIQMLKKVKISTVQITVDGPPKLHCKRKGIIENPEQNFDEILSIIEKLIFNGINVNIRINLDKTNMDSVEELFNILSERNLRSAGIYPGQITSDTKTCSNVESACLHTSEFAELETEFYRLLVEKGLKNDFNYAYPEPKSNFCCADNINSFIIGPDGYVYKCWSEIEGKADAVMDIFEREPDENFVKTMRMRNITWINHNPFEYSECTKCKLLPICMGGCIHYKKAQNKNKPVCMTLKDNLEQMVMHQYYCMKIKDMFSSKT